MNQLSIIDPEILPETIFSDGQRISLDEWPGGGYAVCSYAGNYRTGFRFYWKKNLAIKEYHRAIKKVLTTDTIRIIQSKQITCH